jgi:hypothetical protein
MDDASAIQTLLDATGKGEREPLRGAEGDSKAEADEILKTMKDIGADITEVSRHFSTQTLLPWNAACSPGL